MTHLRDAMDQIEMNGEMVENNDTGTGITITTAGQYYGWVSASSGELENITFSDNAAGDRLVVPVGGAGTYRVEGTFSFAATANSTIQAAIHVSGTINNNAKLRRKIGTGGDIGNASIPPKSIVLAEGDYIDIRFTSDGNGDSVTIYNGNICLRRIKRR